MPWILDSLSRTDEIVRAVQTLIADSGLSAVTYRAIGARLRLSASTLHDHYPDRVHLLRVVAHRTAMQREELFLEQGDRLSALLPESEDDRRLALVWMSLLDLARREPGLGVVVDEARSRQRDLIRQAVDAQRPHSAPASHRQGEAVQSLVEGLTSAITVGAEPMPRARAVELLDLTVTALLGPAAEAA
jgi:AcrR family transcriptional regulator